MDGYATESIKIAELFRMMEEFFRGDRKEVNQYG